MKSSILRRVTTNGWGMLFIAPTVAFFLCVNILPMFYSFLVSFESRNLLSSASEFVFLDNYIAIFQDERFLRAMLNTFLYSAIIVPFTLGISLFIALLLNSGIRWVGIFRTVYFIPVITSGIAAGYLWKWLYDPTFGLLNQMLAEVGVQLPFLRSTWMALPCVAAMIIWKSLGFNIVIFLAGLQGIPDYVYEAARIDKTGTWRTFWKITLPLMNPTVVFLSVMGVMGSLKMFGEVFVMTENGGPLNSTSSMVSQIVATAFQSNQMGYGSAMTVVLFLIIISITLFQMKVLSRKFSY